MAIDDPVKQYEQQYMPEEEEKSPLEIALFVGKLAFPKLGLPLDIFKKVHDRFSRTSVDERLKAMWNTVVGLTEHLESTKVNADDMAEAIQITMRRDAEQFNDEKRERYVKMLGSAFRSEEQIQNVASYIQTVEQLTERDVLVLKVINKVMNKKGDWLPQPNPGVNSINKVHPNTFIHRRQELAVQIAMALGQAVERNDYSREEGYAICNRLHGFGLVHEIEQSRELPLADYIFRLSIQGVILLKLLGEDVPNYEYYIRR